MKAERDTPNRALSAWRAQGLFLEVLNRLEPRVLETLRGAPLEAFHQARASLAGYDWASLKALTEEPDPEDLELVGTRRAIEAWAQDWNLNEPWMLKSACITLELWRTGRSEMRFFQDAVSFSPATGLYSRDTMGEQLEAAFADFMGYEPTYEPASAFKARFMEACERFASEHIAAQEAAAKSRGFPDWPSKHKLELHLEWIVRYQVQNWNQTRIADRYSDDGRGKFYSQSSISEAVKKTAMLLHLTLKAPDFPVKAIGF